MPFRAVTDIGQTALHIAASKGHDAVLALLIAKVNLSVVNIKDFDGMTVLHYACEGVCVFAVL